MPESVQKQVKDIEKAIMKCMESGIKKCPRIVRSRVKSTNGFMDSATNALVYNKYTPKYYKRRKRNGGLTDPKNTIFEEPKITVEYSNYSVGCILQFYNISKPDISRTSKKFKESYKNRFLASMITQGYGIQDKPYNKPRPFMDKEDSYPKKTGVKQRAEKSACQLVMDKCKEEIASKLNGGRYNWNIFE